MKTLNNTNQAVKKIRRKQELHGQYDVSEN